MIRYTILLVACSFLASCASFQASGTFRGKGATVTIDSDGKATRTNVDFSLEDFLNARR